MKMSQICRRTAMAVIASAALAACSQAGSDAETPADTPASAALQDMVMGNADAPVTIVEYASWTCPACLQFHADTVPTLVSDYVETGKVKYVFREFPTAPANISVAGFAIARCAGPDKYFDVLDELFTRQQGIIAVARQGGQVRAALQQVASNHGVDGEEAFDTCLQNQDVRRAIGASIALGDSSGVNATPTIFLNGQKLEGSAWRYPDGLREVLDAALGDDAPVEDAAIPAETDDAPAESPTE